MYFKHTIPFLLLLSAQIYTSGAQDSLLTIQLDNSSLQEIIHEIESLTDFVFVYNTELIDTAIRMDIDFTRHPLRYVLDSIFRGCGTSYEIIERQVVLTPARKEIQGDKTPTGSSSGPEARISVSGFVEDRNGHPVQGVNILARLSRHGAISDPDGRYVIPSIPGYDTLVFSYIGYNTLQLPVNQSSFVNAQLEKSIVGIDEIVVIGYGRISKSDLTGAVSVVNMEDMDKIPFASINQNLQGKVPGMLVTSHDGAPGAGTSILIRGGNSIQASNEPIFVVDGFIEGVGIDHINPSDIQSIEILKDASATAIYGSRGANGVILVTTKKGKRRKPEMSVNAYSGWQFLPEKIMVMDSREYGLFANQYARSISDHPPFPDPELLASTDWQAEITRPAPVHNLNLAAGGGNSRGRYYLSGGYFNQKGIIKNSGFERITLRTNLEREIAKWLRMSTIINLFHSERNRNRVNLDEAVMTPPAMTVYQENGEYSVENPISGEFINHPVAQANLIDLNSSDSKMSLNALGEARFGRGFQFRTSIGLDLGFLKHNNFRPGSLPRRKVENSGGTGGVSTHHNMTFLNENILKYSLSWKETHTVTFTAGITEQAYYSESVMASGSRFVNDATRYHNLSLADPDSRLIIGSALDRWRIISFLGRMNYSMNKKYLLTLSARKDGSSVFGQNNKWAFFPSAAAGWRISEEPFLEGADRLSNLKLRMSYGYSGNQAIQPFQTLPTLQEEIVIFNNTVHIGMVQGRLPNPNLKWESTAQFDIGIESGFFQNRLRLEADYYYKTTKDVLLEVEIPWQTGYLSKISNAGKLRNQGIELMLQTVNISRGMLHWESSLVVSANRNQVLSLGDKDQIIVKRSDGAKTGILKIGEPVGSFYGALYQGTWKSEEEILEEGTMTGAKPGYPRYADLDEDGRFSGGNSDMTKLGNASPLFHGGISNRLLYKNWQFSFFLQFNYGSEVMNLRNRHMLLGNYTRNLYKILNNRWSPENPNSDIPVAGSYNYFKGMPSSLWVEDGSFLRLRNLQLSYTFSSLKRRSLPLNSCQLYLTGTNLWIWSNYLGYDPEVNVEDHNSSTNILRGYDDGAYPANRSLIAGIIITF